MLPFLVESSGVVFRMHVVILTELGISIFENDKFVKSFPFANPANEYVEIKNGEANIGDLEEFLQKQDTGFLVNDFAFLRLLKKKSIEAWLMKDEEIDIIQSTKIKILVESGFAKDENDARTKLRNFALNLSSAKVTKISESPDLHVIHAINALDEGDNIINRISSIVREWYGLHFPELDNIVDSINAYSQIVLAGKRENLTEQIYKDVGFPDNKVEMLSVVQERSKGGQISDENLAIIQGLAKQIIELHELRKTLENHIETQMENIAPNISAILGTAVAARILARAGSLKRLATMPASTIQVLGAEKALFRSLRTGSQPPKHGILFQHPLVHTAPRWQRGKLARAIASKAAIAARVDVFGKGLNQTLLEKLNIRVKEISEIYKEPTEKSLSHKKTQIFSNKKRKAIMEQKKPKSYKSFAQKRKKFRRRRR
ncbi:MAG: rRNA biogenesis protein Nop5/Nop56 [Marine Group I thaumarchaeote]|nr:MAG: rRNA biogenesis protein Nop5/Nop56 [Marine Group I thaumarchaeote]